MISEHFAIAIHNRLTLTHDLMNMVSKQKFMFKMQNMLQLNAECVTQAYELAELICGTACACRIDSTCRDRAEYPDYGNKRDLMIACSILLASTTDTTSLPISNKAPVYTHQCWYQHINIHIFLPLNTSKKKLQFPDINIVVFTNTNSIVSKQTDYRQTHSHTWKERER